MSAALTQLRQVCLRQIALAAKTLGVDYAESTPLRFRVDGKGGVLASPYPMQVGLSPEAVAAACPGDPWLAEIFPSGQWLAFTPSQAWYEAIRRVQPQPFRPLPREQVLPFPDDCPAKITPSAWVLCCLLGKPDPLLAARLDLANPRIFLEFACNQAKMRRGGNCADTRLLRECILLMEHMTQRDTGAVARQAMAVARQYAAAPAEDATVGKLLDALPWI